MIASILLRFSKFYKSIHLKWIKSLNRHDFHLTDRKIYLGDMTYFDILECHVCGSEAIFEHELIPMKRVVGVGFRLNYFDTTSDLPPLLSCKEEIIRQIHES